MAMPFLHLEGGDITLPDAVFRLRPSLVPKPAARKPASGGKITPPERSGRAGSPSKVGLVGQQRCPIPTWSYTELQRTDKSHATEFFGFCCL
jgi:hypothetical protein